MPLPAGVTAVPVANIYTDELGATMAGKVTWTPSITALQVPGADTTLALQSVTVTVGSNGVMNATIIANDDADTTPTGWHWVVKERFPKLTRDRIIQVPAATVGTLQLSDIADATPTTDLSTYALQSALNAEIANRSAADLALLVDTIVRASGVGTRALSVRASVDGDPTGAIFEVLDDAGAVLAEVTAGSMNLNVSPAAYSAVLTGVRMYLGASDPNPDAANGSIWGDTSSGTVTWRERVADAWSTPYGAWTEVVYATNAGTANQIVTLPPPAGGVQCRLEPGGVVRLRGVVGVVAPGIAQGAPIFTVPLAFRPTGNRHMFTRTAGTPSTHTRCTVDTNGAFSLANSGAIAATGGCDIPCDSMTYSL